MDKGKILVLGLGNEILTDDGIGVKLVKHLKEVNKNPDFSFHTAWLGGLEILDYLDDDYQTAIFVDATKTGKLDAGTVEAYDLENFKETLHLSNFHDASFANTIKIAHKLGYKVPDTINIIAIEVAEDAVFGNEFSNQIKVKYTDIVKEVSDLIEAITGL